MYFLVRWLSIAIVRSFFKEVAVLHPERIPLYGPAIFVGNHNNQFMDASMLVANIPRQVRFLVAMKSMKRWVIGLLGRLAGGIPVIRQDDLATVGEGLVHISHHDLSASHLHSPPLHHHHVHAQRPAEKLDNSSSSRPCSRSPPLGATTRAEQRHQKRERDKEDDGRRKRTGAGKGGVGEHARRSALHIAATEAEDEAASKRKSGIDREAFEEGTAAGAAACSKGLRGEDRKHQATLTSEGQTIEPGAEEAEEKGITSWWRAVRSPAQRTRRISDAAAANVAAAADKIAEFESDAAGAASAAGREGHGTAAATTWHNAGERRAGELRVTPSGNIPATVTAIQQGPPLLSIYGDKTHFLRDCSTGCKLLIEKRHYSIVKVLSDTHLLATAAETETPQPRLKRSSSERAGAAVAGEGGENLGSAGRGPGRGHRDGARDSPLSDSSWRRARAGEEAFKANGRSTSREKEDYVRCGFLCRTNSSSGKSRSKSARPASVSHMFLHTAADAGGNVVFSAIRPAAGGVCPAAARPAGGGGEAEERRENKKTAPVLLHAEGKAVKGSRLWPESASVDVPQRPFSVVVSPSSCQQLAFRDNSAACTGERQWTLRENVSSCGCGQGGLSHVSSFESSGQISGSSLTGSISSGSSSSRDSSGCSGSAADRSAEEDVKREGETAEAASVATRKEHKQKEEKHEDMDEQVTVSGILRRRRGRIGALGGAETSKNVLRNNYYTQIHTAVPGVGAPAAAAGGHLSPPVSRHCEDRHGQNRYHGAYKPYKIIPHVDQRKVYEEVSRSLIEGDCIGIFPEGGSHDRTTLLPLKAGVAIMALQGLAAGAEDVMIVPVGLTYHNPHKTQSRATVCIGDPIPISRELAVEYECNRRAATAQILSNVEKGLRSCIITAQDHETIMLIKLSCSLYPPERLRLSPEKYFNLNQLLSKLFWRRSEEPELLKLRQGLVQYQGSLARAGIPDHDVWMLKQSTAGASLFFAEKLIALAYSIALGVPLLPLWGPLRVLARILAEAHRAKALAASTVKVKGTDVVASYKVIVLLVCVPLFNILYGALVGFFFLDSWKETLFTILLCVCLLPVSYYVSMRRAERILPLMRQIRTLIMVLVGKVNVWRENERELVTQRTEMQLCVRETLFDVGPRTSPTFVDELYAIVPKAVLDADTKRLVRKKEDFAPLQMKYMVNNADEIL